MEKKFNTEKLVKGWYAFEEGFMVLALGIMGVVLTAQIVMRYFFSSPFSWAEELARYLQIWITFFGIGYGFRKNSHIALTLLSDRFPKYLAYVVSVINNLVMIFSCGVVLYVAPEFLAQQNKLSSTLHVPLRIVYGIIPVGFAITIVYLVFNIVRDTRKTFTKEAV